LPLAGEAALHRAATRPAAEAVPAGAGPVFAHLALAAEAPPLAAFAARFRERYAALPSADALAGHVAVGMVKAASEVLGQLDGPGLGNALHGLSVRAADQPALLLDTAWAIDGTPDRISFLAATNDPATTRWTILPPLGAT
ncbi:MAG: hypothetical protein KGL55_08070, partial [Rhodospirillales bacterium]|nr:hypothetical protein [Rhodospirillales bacterium]